MSAYLLVTEGFRLIAKYMYLMHFTHFNPFGGLYYTSLHDIDISSINYNSLQESSTIHVHVFYFMFGRGVLILAKGIKFQRNRAIKQ
jgi:hypothetical protein